VFDTSKFEVKRLYQENWLKLTKDNKKGAQALVIDNKIENDIVLKTFTHKNGALWSSFQPQTVLRLFNRIVAYMKFYQAIHKKYILI
jgi:hypothetical protein